MKSSLPWNHFCSYQIHKQMVKLTKNSIQMKWSYHLNSIIKKIKLHQFAHTQVMGIQHRVVEEMVRKAPIKSSFLCDSCSTTKSHIET